MVGHSISQSETLMGTGETTATKLTGILARPPRERCAARTEQQGLLQGKGWISCRTEGATATAAATLVQCSRSEDTASTCLPKERDKFPQSNPSVPILSRAALPPCSCHLPGTELRPPRLAEPHRPRSSRMAAGLGAHDLLRPAVLLRGG